MQRTKGHIGCSIKDHVTNLLREVRVFQLLLYCSEFNTQRRSRPISFLNHINMLLNWPAKCHAESVDSQVAVSEYVNYRVTCISVFFLLRFTRAPQLPKFIQQLTSFLSVSVVGFIAICCVWVGKYLVRHRDVVQLGSVTDDLFCLSNTVVSTQPHYGLRQQPARLTFQWITSIKLRESYWVAQHRHCLLWVKKAALACNFAKSVPSETEQKIYNTVIVKDPITPFTCRYTTLWNIWNCFG